MVRVHPRFQTKRLHLRAFVADDAPRFAELAGRREIADTMLSMPHPLSVSTARSLITGNAAAFQADRSVHFAIEHRDSPGLIGGAGLEDIDRENSQARLSFWIGVESWGHRYAPEAAWELLRYGFVELGLNRIHASHLVRHRAAGSVLQRVAMKQEGVLRESVRKGDLFEDVAIYSLLRSDAGSD